MKKKLCLGFCCWLFAQVALAGIDEDLSRFFGQLGASANVTGANAYQGQAAGHYTGGSLYARSSVRDVQIAQVDLPQFRSGCGGIDLFTGGFSFVSSQELVNAMKNIMNNAAGYAFNLALESAVPTAANTMKYLNTLATSANQFNINSCETAAGLVGAAWPRTHVAQQQVCQDIGASKGLFADYAAARQNCSAGGQMAAVLNSADGPYKNLAFNNANLAWRALQQNSFLRADPQLAEFFMSLSGSIIVTGAGNDTELSQYKALPSLANDPSLLKALLHGGRAKAYRCDTYAPDGCLSPSVQTITVSAQAALGARAKALLTSMVEKIAADRPLAPEEIGLLNAVRMPVYKMLNVQAAFAGDRAILDVASYADFIAVDMLFQYLDEGLALARAQAMGLQFPAPIMAQFTQNIEQARAGLRDAKQSAYAQVATAAQLAQQAQAVEQMLAGSLSAQLSAAVAWPSQAGGA